MTRIAALLVSVFALSSAAFGEGSDTQRLLQITDACVKSVLERDFSHLSGLGQYEEKPNESYRARVFDSHFDALVVGKVVPIEGLSGLHEVCIALGLKAQAPKYHWFVFELSEWAVDNGFNEMPPEEGFDFALARCDGPDRMVLLSTGLKRAGEYFASLIVLGLNDIDETECDEGLT
ncbi:MAG: hypothetical protein AAF631_09335 [Pseudomonadota bacterium]